MEQRLEISLLGRVALRQAGQPLGLPTRKTEALLVYLICTGRPQPRELLAELLWQADSHTQAKRNLTYALYRLRQALEAYISTTRQTIAFNQENPYWLDVAELERGLTAASPQARLTEAEAAGLAEALALYQGDFMAGFHLSDALDFEEWLTIERERLHRRMMEGLDRLVSYYLSTADYANGLTWARRWLALDGLNETAHQQVIRLLALSGQRGPALSQYDAYARLWQAEFGVEPAADIQALREQIQSGNISPLETGRVRAVFPAVPFQAPLPPPHFVGRELDLARLQRGLTQPLAPCIHALVGMGGVGKTTLATQLAHHLRETFSDGVLWANAATSSPMDILVAWAKAYDHDFSGLSDLESRAAAVRNLLADKKTLLIIDNVISSRAVEPLLPSGKGCATLLTTRDLDVAHALNAEAWLVGELSPDQARQMLVYILGEARVANEAAAAWEIGDLLQNLPLAVEIAAKRLKSRARQPLAHMAARLRETKNRLELTISDQAVRASFEVSWEALDEALQQIFPLLAVFAGRPFASEAIAYLAGANLFQVEDHLCTLVALSLLQEEGETHFRQHPLLADFAGEKLSEAEAAYARLSDYYLTFAQNNRENYEALQPEWENILAAIQAADAQQRWQVVIDYTGALAEPWFTQGRHSEARQAYQWSQAAASHLNDNTMLANTLLHWAGACIEQGDYGEAAKHLSASLLLYRKLDDRPGIAQVQYQRSRLCLEHGQYAQAQESLIETLALYTRLGDIDGIGRVLFRQARLQYYLDALDKAQQLAEEALSLQAQSDNAKSMIPTLRILAHITSKGHSPDQAQFYGERARALSEELQDQDELASSLYTLTCIYRLQGALDLAQHYAQASLKIKKRIGDRHGEGMLCHQLSLIHTGLAQYGLALESAFSSLNIFEAVQDKLGCALVLRDIGDLHQQLAQPVERDQVWRKARDLAQELNHASLLAALDERLAEERR